MKREYHKWWSPNLNRNMELLIFGHAGAKVLVFPTRTGRFYEYENLGLVDSIADKINAGQLQLYCVDSVDTESMYCFWAHPFGRMHRHCQYEEYILREVLPLMASKNSHPCTISHGCSLGAYHAATLFLDTLTCSRNWSPFLVATTSLGVLSHLKTCLMACTTTKFITTPQPIFCQVYRLQTNSLKSKIAILFLR